MVNMHSYKNFAMTIAILVFNAFVSTHLVAQSMAIIIYLFPVYLHAT